MKDTWDARSNGEPAKVSVSSEGAVTPMASDGFVWSDPNTWSVSGYTSSDQYFWSQMKHVIEGAYCSSTCTVTDRVVATTTVNPGTISSMINTTVLHSPKSANFKTRRWNYIAICSGAICGNADRIDNLLTVRQTLSNYGNRAGKRLTVAVGITQTTVANTIQTGKKTADCLGRTGTDRRCKYIY